MQIQLSVFREVVNLQSDWVKSQMYCVLRRLGHYISHCNIVTLMPYLVHQMSNRNPLWIVGVATTQGCDVRSELANQIRLRKYFFDIVLIGSVQSGFTGQVVFLFSSDALSFRQDYFIHLCVLKSVWTFSHVRFLYSHLNRSPVFFCLALCCHCNRTI